MNENALPIERIQSYLRALAQSQYEAVSLPPFTLFFHPSDPFPYFSYAIPDVPVRAEDPALPGTLAQLGEVFVERGRTPRFEFFEAFAPELPVLLRANGFTEEARQWSMICTPETYRPAPAVEGVEVVDLTQDSPESDLRAFVIAQQEGFNEGAPSDPTEADIERQRVLMRTGWTCMLAQVDGKPAAVASFGRIIDGISEVAGIATRPAYRRKGIATILAGRCTEMIFTQGGQIATLTAADASAGRVYEKVGFKPFSTMLAYKCEPESSKTPAKPYVSFILKGEPVDPDQITAVLGISPDRSIKRGDPFGKKGGAWEIGLWKISSRDIVESGNLENHIVWVLEQLEPVKDKLAHFVLQDGVEASFKIIFNLFVHEWDDQISSTLMKRISDLNVNFKVSIYYLEDLNDRMSGEKPWN